LRIRRASAGQFGLLSFDDFDNFDDSALKLFLPA